MKLKRTLQFLLLFCVVFLWMPMTANAATHNVANEEAFIKAVTIDAKAGDTVKLTADIEINEEVTFNSSIIIDGSKDDGGTWQLTFKEFSYITNSTLQNLKIVLDRAGFLKLYESSNFVNVILEHPVGGVIMENNGTLVLTNIDFDCNEDGITNYGLLTMESGTITVAKYHRRENYYAVLNVNDQAIFNMNGGVIEAKTANKNHIGINNKGQFNMSNGSIKNFTKAVFNQGTVKMTGGTITGNEYGVYNENKFTMEKGEITGNTIDVYNNGENSNFTRNMANTIVTKVDGNGKYIKVETTPSTPEQETTDEVVITDSEGNIVKEPERWVPTTPDEIKRYAFLGKEAVSYNCPKTNPYEIKILNAMQGPKCFVSFEAALGDYTMGRTYNVYVDGKLLYSTDKKANITLHIPKALQKEGRTFKMICVTEGGLPIVLNDLDKNPETITFETDKFYAFALIYK